MNEHEFNLRLAGNLVKYRKLHGMTQAELAECISYSNKSVSKWERGEGKPDTYVLLKISEIYGVTLSELVGQTGTSKKTADKLKAQEKDKKAQEKAKKKALDRAGKQKKKEKKSAN
ncbi:MAG: helix-turn-helix domain-containing protein [Acutalibacteraceae bacterium]